MSLMLAHFVTAFILPVFFLAHALFYGIFDLNWFWLPIGQYVAATAIRLMIALRFGMPILPAFFHPVTAVLVTYIGIRSVVWAYRPSGALWKGRSYVRATTH